LLVFALVAVFLIGVQVINMKIGGHGAAEPAIELGSQPLIYAIAAIFLSASIVGLIIAFLFLSENYRFFKDALPYCVSSSILTRAFLVYLIGNFALEAIAAAAVLLSGLDSKGDAGNIVYLILQALSMLTAFALGLGAFSLMTGYSSECLRRIGFVPVSVKDALKWGIGCYVAALPFLGAAVLISQKLDKTIFRNIKTPEHPMLPYFTGGEGTSFVVVLIMGAIIAPIVEETFFRGMLYGALRGWMRVWAAAVFSAVIFAVGHPLPAYFLPIFVLGVAFALVREKTGSLIPSMIAHCIQNSVAIILSRLLF